MNLERMLDKCRNEQWKVDDLDWERVPRSMSRDDEIAVVQYFTNMAGIELLAAALFREQQQIVDDPQLERIFATFVADEIRHSKVARRLAQYYDVHHYEDYQLNPDLARFRDHFVNAVRHLSPEFANIYITCGELILDIALLRSLNDYVDDDMSRDAMTLINRDESRHIAVDFHMAEFYTSDAWAERCKNQRRKPVGESVTAWWSFTNVLYRASPFFKSVFFEPMSLTDPTGRRMREAFKRMQLLSTKPRVAGRPWVKFIQSLQDAFNHPVLGIFLGRLVVRVIGVQPWVLRTLYTDEEKALSQQMSFDEMAEDALRAKTLD